MFAMHVQHERSAMLTSRKDNYHNSCRHSSTGGIYYIAEVRNLKKALFLQFYHNNCVIIIIVDVVIKSITV